MLGNASDCILLNSVNLKTPRNESGKMDVLKHFLEDFLTATLFGFLAISLGIGSKSLSNNLLVICVSSAVIEKFIS